MKMFNIILAASLLATAGSAMAENSLPRATVYYCPARFSAKVMAVYVNSITITRINTKAFSPPNAGTSVPFLNNTGMLETSAGIYHSGLQNFLFVGSYFPSRAIVHQYPSAICTYQVGSNPKAQVVFSVTPYYMPQAIGGGDWRSIQAGTGWTCGANYTTGVAAGASDPSIANSCPLYPLAH